MKQTPAVHFGKTVTSRSEAAGHGYPVIGHTMRMVVWCPYCHKQHVHGCDTTSVGGFRLSHCEDDGKRDWYYVEADLTTSTVWDRHAAVPQEP